MKLNKLSKLIQYIKVELSVLFLFGLICIIANIEEGINETKIKKESIGETIVLFGDSLTISEYNIAYGYYILSNGLIYEKQ